MHQIQLTWLLNLQQNKSWLNVDFYWTNEWLTELWMLGGNWGMIEVLWGIMEVCLCDIRETQDA